MIKKILKYAVAAGSASASKEGLATLNDINNGEEVITDDTSKFNLTTASNLITLVSSNLSN